MEGDDLINEALTRVRDLMRRYPAGSVVWHKASGDRMVIDGWKIAGDMMPTLSVVTEAGTGGIVFVFEVSSTPVTKDCDGEEWKA